MKKDENQLLIRSCLTELCTAIGARPTGSGENRLAQQYIDRQFRQMGLQVENQPFTCIHWMAGSAALNVDNEKIPAKASPYSLPVHFSGRFERAETISELQGRDLTDKMLVLAGALAREPVMPKNFRFWNPEHHQQIIRTLESLSPKAIITFTDEVATPVFEDGDFDIPSVVVPVNYQSRFHQNSNHTIELSFEARRIPSTGANVIARLNPTAKKKVIVCAHFDTKPGTPGALDNASGITTLLLTARLLSEADLNVCAEFVAFNGEDYFSTPGQVAYLEKYTDTFGRVMLAINCDGVGYKHGKTGISPMSCSREIEILVEKHIKNYRSLTLADPWYQGDHMLFTGAGIPTLAITSQKIFDLLDTVIHSEKDTIDLIDHSRIAETALFINSMIRQIEKVLKR